MWLGFGGYNQGRKVVKHLGKQNDSFDIAHVVPALGSLHNTDEDIGKINVNTFQIDSYLKNLFGQNLPKRRSN